MKKQAVLSAALFVLMVAAGSGYAAVLVDQPISTVDTNAYAAQEFGDYPTYSSFVGDDFVVPADKTWLIDLVYIEGGGWNGATSLSTATEITCHIFANAVGDVPDGIPGGYGGNGVWNASWLPSDPNITIINNFDFEATLDPAPELTAGTYWISCFPTADFATWGQWGFVQSDTVNGFQGQWINPGGGFGYGAAWQAMTVLGPALNDIAFRLEGEELSAPAVDSIDPASGTNDGVVSVDIAGDFFVDGDTDVKLSGPAKADITATNVVVTDAQNLSCDFDLTGAAAGDYDVVVTTPGGEGTLAAGFEVLEPGDDDDDDDDDIDDDDDDLVDDDDDDDDDDDSGCCG